MKDVFSIIQELTGQYTYLPQGPFKEEHIKELQPVEYVSSYYQNPMQAFHDPRNDQKYIIEWKNEKGRVKELKRINKLIAEYNLEADKNASELHKLVLKDRKGNSQTELGFEKQTVPIEPQPLWAFYCIPKLSMDKNSGSGRLMIDDEELYRMLYFEIKDEDIFVKRFNKMIFDHICEMLHQAVELGQYNEKSIWFDPSIGFLNWFQAKGIDHKSIEPLIESKISSRAGRPKGHTKRTIDRYKKVSHQFEQSRKKFPNKKKSELYELVSTQDYDGTTYSRKTIRNIIEEKRYNLKPSR